MSLYELMFIIRPDLEDEALEEAILKVKELAEKENGAVISLKKMGKRKLAYEIDDFKEGIYVVADLKAEANVVPALDHFFKVNEGYLRYIVIRRGGEEQVEVELDNKETLEKTQEPKNVQEEANKGA